jgi:hypothetical protein
MDGLFRILPALDPRPHLLSLVSAQDRKQRHLRRRSSRVCRHFLCEGLRITAWHGANNQRSRKPGRPGEAAAPP